MHGLTIEYCTNYLFRTLTKRFNQKKTAPKLQGTVYHSLIFYFFQILFLLIPVILGLIEFYILLLPLFSHQES